MGRRVRGTAVRGTAVRQSAGARVQDALGRGPLGLDDERPPGGDRLLDDRWVDDEGRVDDNRRVDDDRRVDDGRRLDSGWLPGPPAASRPDDPHVGPVDVPAGADDARSRYPVAGSAPAVRALLAATVPGPVRAGRWGVSWRAAAAGVVLAVVAAAGVAARTADAVPVQPVPARPSAGVGGAAQPDPSAPSVEPLAVGGAADTGGPTAPSSGAPAGAGAVAGGGQAVGGLVVVHVVGQVGAPGVVRVPGGSRVADALQAAGGSTAEADLSKVNLARVVVDGEQVVVPRPGEAVTAVGAPAGGGGAGAPASGPGGQAAGPVDLNAADEAALDALPGIGEVLAGRIIAWRQERGPFTSVAELGEVSGIGDALISDLTPLVTV